MFLLSFFSYCKNIFQLQPQQQRNFFVEFETQSVSTDSQESEFNLKRNKLQITFYSWTEHSTAVSMIYCIDTMRTCKAILRLFLFIYMLYHGNIWPSLENFLLRTIIWGVEKDFQESENISFWRKLFKVCQLVCSSNGSADVSSNINEIVLSIIALMIIFWHISPTVFTEQSLWWMSTNQLSVFLHFLKITIQRYRKVNQKLPFSLKVPEDDYFYLDNYLSYYEDYYYHLFLKDSFIIKSFFYTEKKWKTLIFPTNGTTLHL